MLSIVDSKSVIVNLVTAVITMSAKMDIFATDNQNHPALYSKSSINRTKHQTHRVRIVKTLI